MKKLSLIVIILVLFFIALGQALVKENIVLLLPNDNEVAPWKMVDSALMYKGEDLYDFIDGGAEIFLEYGFNQVISQEYQYEDFNLITSIYQMDDNIAAFGIFSNNRSSRFKNIKVGNGAFQTDYSIIFWQSEYFVAIESFQSGPFISEALLKFANLISQKINKVADVSEIINLLPDKGLIPESQKLVKGILGINNTYYFSEKDIFQLMNNGIGLFADYSINGEATKLFLVKYKTSAKAQSAFDRIQNFFNSNPDYKSLQSEQYILFWQKEETYFAAINKEPLIGLVFEAKSRVSALELLNLLK